MKLVVDGEIYQRQPYGGISRIFNEVLPRLCDREPRLDLTLITDGGLRQTPPVHAAIKHRALPSYQKVLRPGRLWRPVTASLKRHTRNWWVRPNRDSIWQATFYTPPSAWSGHFTVMFHDLMEERYPQWFSTPRHETLRQLKRQCARTADVIICNSRVTQQDVCRAYGVEETRTRVVHLAAGAAFRRLAQDELADFPQPRRPYLLFVGGRSPYKNFDFLLRAFSTWPDRQHVTLAIVGAPLTAMEEALVHSLGVGDCVKPLGYVNDQVLCRLYNEAAAFVYPSIYEGFGIPLLESLACGCPLVASRIPTTLEVVGDLPFYFDPSDESELHRACSAALHCGRWEDRVKLGIERAQGFSWDITAAALLDIYHGLEADAVATAD